MHAYLVIGQDKEQRHKKVTEITGKIREVITISAEGKHTIETVRRLKSSLSLTPLDGENGRAVIVEEAQLFTHEAANAFLKTLEEPVGKTIFILMAPIAEQVIETIVSRCQLINLGKNTEPPLTDASRDVFEILTKSHTSARLAFIENIKDREVGIAFCSGQASITRKKMQEKPSLMLAKLLERIEETRRDLEANVNVKLTLADLVLNYPTSF